MNFDWLYLLWLDSYYLAFLCLMTRQDFDILWMSRPRLIETGKFLGCRDWDSSIFEKFLGCRDRYSSRLGKLMDVETQISRDWAKDVDTETPSRLSLISAPNRIHHPKGWSPPAEHSHHPQMEFTNFENIDENITFIFTPPGCFYIGIELRSLS